MSKDLAKQRREEILAAATRCFIRNGIHASGMSAIAKEFGMSAGHIYNYFPSKSAIIEEIVARGLKIFYHFTESLKGPARHDYEHVYKLLKNLFEQDQKSHYFVLSLDVLLEAGRDPTLRSYLIEQDAKTRAFLKEKALEENIPDSPELPLDARIDVMMGLLEGIGLRKLRNPDIDVDNVCKILAKMIAHETKVFEV